MSELEAVSPIKPTEGEPATEIDEVPQQASTSPGDGFEVKDDPTKPSFKDQVLGYAKIARGTALRKSDTKEKGKRILEGDTSLHKFPNNERRT